MSITFNEIASDWLLPGGYLEFNQSLAGSLVDQPSVLFVGEMLSTGNAELNKIYRVTNNTDALAKFGEAAQLTQIVKLALLIAPALDLYFVAATKRTGTDSTPLEMAAIIEQMGNKRFDYIAYTYDALAPLQTLRQELSRRWNAMVARESRAFCALPFGLDDSIEFAEQFNSPHLNLIPIGLGQPAWKWTTVITCVMAQFLSNDAAKPETDLVLPYIDLPTTEFTDHQQNVLLHNGCGTWSINGDAVQLSYLVTTYRLNPQGEQDSAYRDTQVCEILKRWRRYVNYMAMKTFAGYKIAKDASLFASGQKILDPTDFKAFLQELYLQYGMREKGWFDDFENYRNSMMVEIDKDNQDRLNYTAQPTLIGQFRQVRGVDQFITN